MTVEDNNESTQNREVGTPQKSERKGVRPPSWKFFKELFFAGAIFLIAAILTDRRIYSWFIYLPDALSAYQQRLLDYISTIFLIIGWVIILSAYLVKKRAEKTSLSDKRVVRFKKIVMTVLVLAIVSVVALVMLEMVFRAAGFTSRFQSRFHKIHQISENRDIVYELKPDSKVTMREDRKPVHYSINSLGFRDDEMQKEKNENQFRILAVGDSVTFGFGIEAEDRYTDKLEEMLNNQLRGTTQYQVINTGVGGWSLYNEAAFLKSRGMELEPDLVIVGFCYNDVNEPGQDFETHTFERLGDLPWGIFPNPEQAYAFNRWKIRPDKIGFEAVFLTYALRYSAFISWLQLRIDYALHPERYENLRPFDYQISLLSNSETVEWNWLKKQFREMKSTCEKAGVPCMVIIFPVSYQVDDPPGKSDRPVKLLTEFLEEEGFYVYNPIPVLKRHSESELYISEHDYTHLNPYAHNILAENLLKQLKEWNLLK